MTTLTWKDLNFWNTPEWLKVLTVLKDNNKLRPRPQDIFRPLIETPLDKVRVVILGGEPSCLLDSDGLAFSYPRLNVDHGARLPTTLFNIFEEYEHDLQFPTPKTGSLARWAEQGVLLWNAVPTTENSKPNAHVGVGWHRLTNEILNTCYHNNPNTVFVLWTTARKAYLDFLPANAKVIDSPSPSTKDPDWNMFFGSDPFTKVNKMLNATGQEPVKWRLT